MRGLGLGLALCRENAVLMGGALTVESALGVGSEFTFEFPAERVFAVARKQALRRPDRARWWATRMPGARTIAGQLGDAGVMVEMASDGYLGLALAERIEAQRGALDLVIVQGRLLGMAAEVFVLRLRDTPFGRRAVMIWLGDGGETAQGRCDGYGGGRSIPGGIAGAATAGAAFTVRGDCSRWHRQCAAAAFWWSRTTR